MRKMILSLIISFMLFSCDIGEQEIIVVPKDYKGYVLIIFNQKDGNPTKYEGKKRVYEIPQNGILKTQFTGNYGSVGFADYYYENISLGNKLSSFVEIEKMPIDKIVGFRGATGTVKKSAESEERIEFVEFYIGTKSQIEQAQQELEKLDIVKLAQ